MDWLVTGTNCGRKRKLGLSVAALGGWRQQNSSTSPPWNKRIVTKEIPGKRRVPAGRKTVEALLWARCFLVAPTSRRDYGRSSTRTVWLAVFAPLVGSVIASAKE